MVAGENICPTEPDPAEGLSDCPPRIELGVCNTRPRSVNPNAHDSRATEPFHGPARGPRRNVALLQPRNAR